MSIEVESSDVVKLTLQFLKENGLTRSFKVLQEESQICLNTVENIEDFKSDILNGRWDTLLKQVETLQFPSEKLIELYEQVIIEMLELREIETAQLLLRETPTMLLCRQQDPDKYYHLEQLCSRSHFDPREAYGAQNSKEKRRNYIAERLCSEVQAVQPSRLMMILSQALKYQKSQGLIPADTKYDLFAGKVPLQEAEQDTPPEREDRLIQLGKASHLECAKFSPDGLYLATGSVDGFIEIWDPLTIKLKTDLTYQQEEMFMSHAEAVLTLNFSKESELLCSGSQDGQIRVWRVATGKCLKKFDKAHPMGITCLMFNKDSTQIITGSFDKTVRIHGIKSGRTIKEFRSHTSYVNDVIMSYDFTKLISASSDGSVKLWDAKTSDLLMTFKPPQPNATAELTVNSVMLNPKNNDQIIVCNKSNTIYMANTNGQIIKTFSNGKKEGGDFIACCLSPKAEWLYGIAEDNFLYCFDFSSGNMEHILNLKHNDLLNLVHHPFKNLLVTFTGEGKVAFWKP
eukprot:CAMPEP_0114979430 /NCGR_PEP_ID=MMETSP0216-20121206/4365_1 /TAXON_ID=223996 /ORGANISM="Protocruzia adherens, Strain Boccale" /LENGTH=513 /DNA_ID=CAMNT_0002340751 /DNA_START=500 /DNA_END=2041 /DNA_ORIENTATION=-